MLIFESGLDETTRLFLADKGFTVTSPDDPITELDVLVNWIISGDFSVLVLNLSDNWGPIAIKYLRTEIPNLAIVGISDSSSTMRWSEYRSLFLENGGDDLLKNPCNPRELAASIRAAVRRSNGLVADTRQFTSGDAVIRVNLTAQVVLVNNISVLLTGKERQLVMLLAAHRDVVITKERLLNGMYSHLEDEPELKIIDVFVCKARKKFDEIAEGSGGVIETVWGRGYRMK